MANEQFKLGDLVKLASGGVAMTIDNITPEGIEVVYMEGTTAKYNVFKPHVLVKVKASTLGDDL